MSGVLCRGPETGGTAPSCSPRMMSAKWWVTKCSMYLYFVGKLEVVKTLFILIAPPVMRAWKFSWLVLFFVRRQRQPTQQLGTSFVFSFQVV